MIGKLVIVLIGMLALYLTVNRGAVYAFVKIFLPCILMLGVTPKIMIPGLPDVNATNAAIYGILVGIALKGGEALPFRWNLLDSLVCLLQVSCVITAWLTEGTWPAVNVFGTRFLAYVAPYFLMRCMFHDAEMRRQALWVCVTCAIVIGMFALVELKLRPYFLSRTLKDFGLNISKNTMVMWRLGLARTQGPFCHPIDMGAACLLISAMIGILASTTRVGLQNRWVQIGLCAAIGASLSSLSYTTFMALAAFGAVTAMIWFMPATGRLLVVISLAILLAGYGLTLQMQSADIWEQGEEIGQTASDSLRIRTIIVQKCWPYVTSAGFFGYGDTISRKELDLDSVDNSYILFAMKYGYVYLVLFLLIPIVLSRRAAKALSRARVAGQWQPLALAVGASISVMIAMYTVWFGFIYAILWLMMLAMFQSMTDVLLVGPPKLAPDATRLQSRVRPAPQRQPAFA